MYSKKVKTVGQKRSREKSNSGRFFVDIKKQGDCQSLAGLPLANALHLSSWRVSKYRTKKVKQVLVTFDVIVCYFKNVNLEKNTRHLDFAS